MTICKKDKIFEDLEEKCCLLRTVQRPCTSDNRGKFNYTSVFGRGLVIASLNINSLPSHIDEFRVSISCSKVDILIINESKLDSTIHDNELYLPGFEVVRRDHRVNGRKGGGVCIFCIYLRTNLNFRIRGDLNNDNLECLFVEISMPRSTGFVVGTWNRPLGSPIEFFNEFEKLIDKIHAENKELYLLGDVNCNSLPETTAHLSPSLTNSLDIYGLSQYFTELTRITQVSKSLIDLCITNSPEKVSHFRVVHVGISDHSLVFMTRKANYDHNGSCTIEMQQFKNFQKEKFLNDLEQMPWRNVSSHSDPNEMWKEWKKPVCQRHGQTRASKIKKNS